MMEESPQAQMTTSTRGQELSSQCLAASQVLGASPATGRAVLARLFRAAGHPARLALLELLSAGEHNATACVEHVGLSQARVATHLACLSDCGFILSRRSGRFVYYRVADPRVLQLVLLARSLAADNAAELAACTRIDNAPHRDGDSTLLEALSRESIDLNAVENAR